MNNPENIIKKNSLDLSKILKGVKYTNIVLSITGIYLAVITFIAFKYHRIGDYGVETDLFWTYIPTAKKFLQGNFVIDDFHGPLYPMMLALGGLLTSNLFVVGVVISILSSAASIIIFYRIIEIIFGRAVSLGTVFLLVFNPVFVEYSFRGGTDMFFVMLAGAGIYFLFYTDTFAVTKYILSGVFCGLAYLTRYNGFFLVPVSLIFILLFENKKNIKSKLFGALIYLASMFITILPWCLHLLKEKGSMFYNKNYLNMAFGIYYKYQAGYELFLKEHAREFSSFKDVLLKDPRVVAGTMLDNFYSNFCNDIKLYTGWHIGAVILALILISIFTRPGAKKTVYIFYGLSLSLILSLIFYSERFSLFLIPFYSSVVIDALLLIKNKIALVYNKRNLRYVYYTFSFLAVYSLFIRCYSYNNYKLAIEPVELQEVIDWVSENKNTVTEGMVISARKPHISYHLKMKYAPLPYVDTYQEFIDKLREAKVDLLVFGRMEVNARPNLAFLLDPDKNSKDLIPLFVHKAKHSVVLYRVRPV